MNNRKAFTLVEALVVVAIIGIMVTIAMPAFNRFFQMYKFRTAMNQMVTDIRSARQAAITNARPVKITFVDMTKFPEISGMTGGYAIYMLNSSMVADMALMGNWEEIASAERVYGVDRPEKPRFLPEPIRIDPADVNLANVESDDTDNVMDLVFLGDGSIYEGPYPIGGATILEFKSLDDVNDPTLLSPGFTLKTVRGTQSDRYTIYMSLFGKVSVHGYHS